jgi:predicted small lipoprotein YifL
MYKPLVKLLLITTVVITLASCGSKTPKETKYIPKDATAVVVVNPKSLEDKMKTGNLSLDSFVNKFTEKEDTANQAKAKKLWDDFKASGVSLDDNLFLFVVQKGSMQKGQSTAVSVLATIKDEAKFEAYVKKQQEQLKDNGIQKESNFSYLVSSYNSSVAWNKEVVIVTMYNKDSKMSFDSLGNYQTPDETVTKKEQKAEVARYFSLKADETVGSIALFNDLFKEKADGYLFTTSSGTLAALSAMPLNLPKLQELLKDNYSTATFNFEDGKIVAKSVMHTNPMLSSLLKKYAGPTVNIAALEKFPSQNINGAMLVSFNPELFNGLLKELEVGGIVDGFLSGQGLTSADIFKALKGEINVIVSDFTIASKEVSYPGYDGKPFTSTQTLPTAKLIFSASIGNKIAFDKIMEKAVQTGFVEKTSTGYRSGAAMAATNLFLMADDKNLIIASDSATYAAYTSGTGKATIDADVLSKLKGKSTATFVDIASLLTGAIAGVKDETGIKVMTATKNTFKNAIVTSDNFSGSSLSSYFEVNMSNTKQNSLVSTLNLISEIYAIIKADENKRKEMNSTEPASFE